MSETQHAANKRGVIAMIVSQAAFVASDCLVKLAAAQMPTGEIMFLRGIIASLCLLALIAALGQTRAITRIFAPPLVARALVEIALIITFLSALPLLPLGVITAITQTAPLILTALAVIVFREPVGWRRWCAIAAGFCGALLVSKPDRSGLSAAALLALAAAVLIACRDILTRFAPQDMPSLVITFTTSTMAILAGAGLASRETWIWPQPLNFALLAAAAIVVSAGNFFIIQAFRGTEVQVVSPFRYVVVIFGMSLGWLVWREAPDIQQIGGAALIAGAGMYMMHRERLRAKAARGSPQRKAAV